MRRMKAKYQSTKQLVKIQKASLSMVKECEDLQSNLVVIAEFEKDNANPANSSDGKKPEAKNSKQAENFKASLAKLNVNAANLGQSKLDMQKPIEKLKRQLAGVEESEEMPKTKSGSKGKDGADGDGSKKKTNVQEDAEDPFEGSAKDLDMASKSTTDKQMTVSQDGAKKNRFKGLFGSSKKVTVTEKENEEDNKEKLGHDEDESKSEQTSDAGIKKVDPKVDLNLTKQSDQENAKDDGDGPKDKSKDTGQKKSRFQKLLGKSDKGKGQEKEAGPVCKDVDEKGQDKPKDETESNKGQSAADNKKDGDIKLPPLPSKADEAASHSQTRSSEGIPKEDEPTDAIAAKPKDNATQNKIQNVLTIVGGMVDIVGIIVDGNIPNIIVRVTRMLDGEPDSDDGIPLGQCIQDIFDCIVKVKVQVEDIVRVLKGEKVTGDKNEAATATDTDASEQVQEDGAAAAPKEQDQPKGGGVMNYFKKKPGHGSESDQTEKP